MLTVKEVGVLLNIRQTTVYKLMRSRQIPFVKIGRCTRIEREAVRAYIDRQRIGNKPRW
ncbi:MAG: helix-turn-helix domain-containing protein [Candidatus Eremiobacteraeota bacterium]|nr:helix-turn-helix domain-containing protein [Candidatus Eremiobacteraeota bacterium]MBC5828556.1 helix-turn-helix domain-containing protein [Candidatus Eremiobacteraeota bacterium]